MTASTTSGRSRPEPARGAHGRGPVLADAGVAFRAVLETDRPFLLDLYAGTREDELAVVDWDDAQKRSFLAMQFDAQHRFYVERYPDAAFMIVEQHGRPIGRLYVDRRPEEIRLMDIALLPAHRGHGLGTRLIGILLDEARAAGQMVRIHVEQFNPALRLYERLGFRRIEQRGVYWFMEWTPQQEPARTQEATASLR